MQHLDNNIFIVTIGVGWCFDQGGSSLCIIIFTHCISDNKVCTKLSKNFPKYFICLEFTDTRSLAIVCMFNGLLYLYVHTFFTIGCSYVTVISMKYYLFEQWSHLISFPISGKIEVLLITVDWMNSHVEMFPQMNSRYTPGEVANITDLTLFTWITIVFQIY